MRTTAVALAAVCAALAARGGGAHAADQTILGRTLVVKNPTGANEKRKIVGVAKELGSPETIVGDPTAAGAGGGALVQLSLDGGSPSTQSFVLAQGMTAAGRPFWSGSAATGFLYKDVSGEQGPVKVLKIKRSGSATFLIKAVIQGTNGAVDVVPPNPGSGACLSVQLGLDASGDRYSVQYGSDAQLVNYSTRLFKVLHPASEGVCPGAVSTTTTSTTVMTTSSTTTSSSSTSTTSSSSTSSSTTSTSTSSTSSISSTTSSTTSTSTTSSTSSTSSTSTSSTTSSSTTSSTSTTVPPLPAKIAAAGDSITQAFAADCTNVLCLLQQDKPQYSWFNGTDAAVTSVHQRYLALAGSILSQRQSVSGAEMRGGGDNFAAQAARILTQVPLPDHVEVLLGGNDICNRDCVNAADCGNPVYTDTQWRDAVRAGLDPLVAGLPLGSTIYLLGVPRVQDLREVGVAKSSSCDGTWSTFSICRIITNGGTLSGESYATRKAGVAERQQRYNEILRDEAAAYNANTTGQNPRGIEVVADYIDELTPSVGTSTFATGDIDGGDCFHPSIAGQNKLAFGAWANNPDHP